MENKLDPEFKAKWIAALRSGEYKQSKKVLQGDGGYCCMGVAYVVATGNKNIHGTSILPDHKDSNLVPKLLIWPNGGRKNDPRPCETIDLLAGMNDSGKSFYEIADYIEANL